MQNSHIRRGVLAFVCLAVFLLLTTPTAGAAGDPKASLAADPFSGSEDYSAVLYDNKNGLPTSEANTIAQTEEGFLWIGCYSGLIRYDGNTFERIDPATGVGSVMCLCVDSRDRLWIGTNENGLAMMERGEFRIWGEDDGLGSAKIRAIAEEEDGTICVGTTAGITMIDPDLSLRAVEDPRIADAFMADIRPGPDGLLYCLTDDGDFFTMRGGEPVDYIDHTEAAVQGITCILPDPDVPGSVYVGTEETGIYHGDLRDGANALDYLDIAPLSCVNEMQLLGGRLWICTQYGIGVSDGSKFINMNELPVNSLVDHVMADYEGNLWFTSSRQGVMKIVSNRFTDVFARFELPENVINATCMYEGWRISMNGSRGRLEAFLPETGPDSEANTTVAARTVAHISQSFLFFIVHAIIS